MMSVPGSSGRPGSPAPSCCACSPPTPSFDVVFATADTQAGDAGGRPVPVARRGLPDARRSTAVRPRRASTGSTSCSSACRTRRAWRWRPQLVGRVGCVVDLSAAFRLQGRRAYPQWYGFEHDQPELLAEAVYGLPELHRAELEGRPAGRHARLLRDGGDARARPAARCRADRADRHHRRRRQRRVRRRPGGHGRRRRSARSTRTSSPTGCSTTATPPRSSRTSAPRCCSRPTWRR